MGMPWDVIQYIISMVEPPLPQTVHLGRGSIGILHNDEYWDKNLVNPCDDCGTTYIAPSNGFGGRSQYYTGICPDCTVAQIRYESIHRKDCRGCQCYDKTVCSFLGIMQIKCICGDQLISPECKKPILCSICEKHMCASMTCGTECIECGWNVCITCTQTHDCVEKTLCNTGDDPYWGDVDVTYRGSVSTIRHML